MNATYQLASHGLLKIAVICMYIKPRAACQGMTLFTLAAPLTLFMNQESIPQTYL